MTSIDQTPARLVAILDAGIHPNDLVPRFVERVPGGMIGGASRWPSSGARATRSCGPGGSPV